ncbi:MAG: UPF0182 family protein, partial [Spirochaetia bacterium]
SYHGQLENFYPHDRGHSLILTEDGGMKYILDGYTTARTYPYLFQYTGGIGDFAGANYLRNPVKVTVDAYSRKVKIYVIDDTDPELFYQKEDVWEFVTEFVLMMPYTPKNKNVMNAWIAGRSDGDNYGELKVYTFPKGIEVLGPRQIEARIDQNPEMSRTLSLWGQRGSEVIRGNLLAVPLFSNGILYILYVEPIYLQAEDAALPEIRRVAIADQDRVVWASTFDRAVELLLGQAEPEGEEPAEEIVAAVDDPEETAEPEPAPAEPLPEGRQAVAEIESLLNEYRNNAGAGDYAAAGRNLERIEEIVSEAMRQ